MMEIKAIILDWAGTTIDYGSLTPIYAMQMAFREFDLDLPADIIRKYMGLHKLTHIQSILKEDYIQSQLNDSALKSIDKFSEELLSKLLVFTKQVALSRSHPIDGVVEFIDYYRSLGIKIGSTTGYTREMMNDIIPIASKLGVNFDSIVTSDEVPSGRPLPWMIYKNAINMKVFPLWKMIKIGDTVADIQEGINAGMWVIALTKCGNEVGYSAEEIENISEKILSEKILEAEYKFINEGAHYIANSIADTYEIIDDINKKIKCGIMPFNNNNR